MASETGANRLYRDRLFKFIFGNPEHKEWTLSLYNALNGSAYTDADADGIMFTTIDDVIYMGMKNDVSFMFFRVLNMFEQQSSFNPNMPVRFLIYGGMLYAKYIKATASFHEYSSALQKLPVPKCVCFYNGAADMKDDIVLKLSDAFEPGLDPDIEVKVRMININYGHNEHLLGSCKPLREYSFFVDRIWYNRGKTETLEEAIDAALDELPDDSAIKPYLLENKAEVKYMCITEYDEARTLAEQKEEGIAIGEARGVTKGIAIGEARGEARGVTKGIAIGVLNTLTGLVKNGILTFAQAAEAANMSVDEFKTKSGLNAQ